MFITHRPTLTLQLHNFDLFRTCHTSSFYTVVWQLARFQLTRCIARSLGDSWACCAPTWRVGSWLDLGTEDHSFHKNAACSLLWYYHSLYFSWCSCDIDQNVFALLTVSRLVYRQLTSWAVKWWRSAAVQLISRWSDPSTNGFQCPGNTSASSTISTVLCIFSLLIFLTFFWIWNDMISFHYLSSRVAVGQTATPEPTPTVYPCQFSVQNRVVLLGTPLVMWHEVAFCFPEKSTYVSYKDKPPLTDSGKLAKRKILIVLCITEE